MLKSDERRVSVLRRYLALGTAAFLGTLLVASAFGVWALPAAFLLSGLVLLMKKQGKALFPALLTGILVAGFLFLGSAREYTRLAAMEGETVSFEGVVLSSAGHAPCRVRAKTEDGTRVLLLYGAPDGESLPQPGETFRGVVRLGRPCPDRDSLLLPGGLAISGGLLTQEPTDSGPFPLAGGAVRLRERMLLGFSSLAAGPDAALARGMLTGDLSDVPAAVCSDFSASGIAHILAVSGLHLSILLGLASFLADRLLLSRKARALLSLGCCLFMLVTAGFSVSVLRAAAMTSLLLLGELLGCQSDPLTSLAAAAGLLVLLNPAVLGDLSYGLTCTATLGILLFAKPIAGLFHPERRVLVFLRDALSVSLAAQLGALPLTMTVFGYLPLYSLLINLLILPLVPAVLFFDLLTLPFLAFSFGAVPFAAAQFFASLLRHIAHFFAGLPGAVLPVRFPRQAVVMALLLLFLFLLTKIEKKRLRLGLTAAVSAAFAVFLLLSAPLAASPLLTLDHTTGALLLQEGDRALLLEATDSSYEVSQLSRLLLRSGEPRLLLLYHPAAYHDLTAELRLAKLLEPEAMLTSGETAILGEDQLPEGTKILPEDAGFYDPVTGLRAEPAGPYGVLLTCRGQKVLKCWAGYDIITADDIPPDAALVIDRDGRVFDRDFEGSVLKKQNATLIRFEKEHL